MNGRFEEREALERMRAQLVEAENALAKAELAKAELAKAELAKADKWLEEASTTAQRLSHHGSEWNEGGIAPVRDLLISDASIKRAREGLSRLITNLDETIEGPGD